ncbi:TonB-dependent receptor [Novosphingobium sediminicola]|nr:TonB-dependent receptor [Novosphingobium sediminicola]
MPLDQALAHAAEALGIQLLFDPTPLHHQQAPAIKGRLTPTQALAQLLAGSHFQAVSGNGLIFVLRPAPAKAPAPHPSAPAQPNPAWPPIIVTAARYSQDAQKSALGLSILPGRGLAMAAATGAEQVLNGIPGINSSRQPDGISINIRALGADMPSGTTQGSVALEFDGIYSIMALGTSIGWYDIDRVEISKGPQSTRYGPNAEGGIVNVITAQPRLNDFSGSATVTLGSAGLRRVEAGQTIPMGPRAALRLSGMAAARNSWFTPALADLATQSMRANLLFKPSAPLQFRVGAEISHLGGTGGGAEADVPFVVDKVAPYAADSINASGNPWALGDRTEGRNHADL